jgi:hypothetical protein
MPDDIVRVDYERDDRTAIVERCPHGWIVRCLLHGIVKLRAEREDGTQARQFAREWVENRRQSPDIAYRLRSLREKRKPRRRDGKSNDRRHG